MGRKAARRGAKNKVKTGAKAKNDEHMIIMGKRIAEMGRATGYQGKVTGGSEREYGKDKWGAGIWGK